MPQPVLESFIAACRDRAACLSDPVDCVTAIAPLMHGLLGQTEEFLRPEHLRADPEHYARNAIHVPRTRLLSLFALVWNPGQWTPVHDHSSWGVVGIVRGVLQERNYIRIGADDGRDAGISLLRGGVILMSPGTVTSFVPNPDHIHVTGVPEDGAPTVSLHLYGREMNSFHVYDVAAGTRRLIDVPYNES